MKSRSGAGAFTLTELLVTIGLIGVLASLLLPACGRAKEKARSTQCTNNLRQWGFACRQYADDNKDFLPRRGQGVKPLQQIDRPEDWFNSLPPYLNLWSYQRLFTNNQRLQAGAHSPFVCPTAKDPGSNHFLPYGMNMNLCPWGDSGLTEATKFSSVIQPVRVVSLTDSPGPYSATFPSKNPYTPVPRHNGRLNILFLAGNVQTVAGTYVGCGVGDPRREDVRWLTGTDSDANVGKY
jgi:prepilin-type N-terminal cleavage/methylation domain-containing protein